MDESPITTHRSRTRLSANKNRKSNNKLTPNQRVGRVKKEPDSPVASTPPSSISSTPTPSKDSSLNVSTPRDEDDYRNHEIYTSSPFTIASSQMPLPGKEVFWNFDTPQAKKLREKMKAEASPVLPAKKMSVPRERMQIAKSRREQVVDTEESEECNQVFEEFLELCKPIPEHTNEVEIKNENQNVEELEMRFKQSSMSPKLERNNVDGIKKERESVDSDLFGDDMDDISDLFPNNGTDSVEQDGSDLFGKDDSDIPPEVKTENQPIAPIKNEIVENLKMEKVSTSALFEDDDDSFLIQCTQAAEVEIKPEPRVSVKTENPISNKFNVPNVPKSVISTGSQWGTKPAVKPIKESNLVAKMNKPVSIPNKPLSIPTKPLALKDITSIIQPNKPVNPVIDTLTGEDEFGDDDSFDMLMSQMSEEDVLRKEPGSNEPKSPVLTSKSSKRRKCFQLDNRAALNTSPVLKNPTASKLNSSFKRFKSADDTATKPTTKSSSLSVRRIQSSPSIPQYQGPQVPGPRATSNSATAGKMRQTSGPANPANVTNNFVKNKLTSVAEGKTSVVKCTKEDIDRKRKEALKKRQLSQKTQNSQ